MSEVRLLRLAILAGRRSGVTLQDVQDRFEVSRSTAQRMLRDLEQVFNVETQDDEERHRHWRVIDTGLDDLVQIKAAELAALDLAASLLADSAREDAAKDLLSLKDKVEASLPPHAARRIEPDYEALLTRTGRLARAGAKPHVDRDVMATISTALVAPEFIEIRYKSRADSRPATRTVYPLGILSGPRSYLVAKTRTDWNGPERKYRLDGIVTAKLTGKPLRSEIRFDLEAYSKRGFGAYSSEPEHTEIVWKFAPGEPAARAKEFVFHATQVFEPQSDGSLIVRFKASGLLEMCWFLYPWGDKVEVLAPRALADMVKGYQRSDFPALP